MRRQKRVKSNSSIYNKIRASRMSEHETQLALDAMRHADLFAGGVRWTMHKVEQWGEQLFGKPAVEH